MGSARALTFGLTDPRIHLGWFVGADFEDARRELDLFIEWAADLQVIDRKRSTISSHKDQQCVVRVFSPATLTLPAIDFEVVSVSGYDPLKIGREEPDFIVGCEVSRWDVELWHRCQGRLIRNYPRSWGFFSGSPETDQGWFPEVVAMGQGPNTQGIWSSVQPSWINGTKYPGGADNERISLIRAQNSVERFAARFEGRPTRTKDAVLPEFKNTLHIYPVNYTPGFPVYVYIDPGTEVYACEFVQIVGDEVHVLDEVYAHRLSQEQILQAVMTRESWKYVREGVIDVAGGQHHFSQGSPEEIWLRETGIRLRAEFRKIPDTVERLRSVMSVNPVTQRPRLLIHPKCKGIISELGGGPSPVQGHGMWRVGPGGEPNTKNCDALKALGYGLLCHFGSTKPHRNDVEDSSQPTTYLRPAIQSRDLLVEALGRSHSPSSNPPTRWPYGR